MAYLRKEMLSPKSPVRFYIGTGWRYRQRKFCLDLVLRK